VEPVGVAGLTRGLAQAAGKVVHRRVGAQVGRVVTVDEFVAQGSCGPAGEGTGEDGLGE
jgi:hypothetical protein